MDYIEERLDEVLTIDEIAKQAGYSKYHFHRIFKNNIGISISDYIRQRRLARASSALLYTNLRILDIALQNQFESQEAFTRAFKKYYRFPPGQYRKLMSDILKNKEDFNMKQPIKGWFLSGSDPFDYEMGIDRKVSS